MRVNGNAAVFVAALMVTVAGPTQAQYNPNASTPNNGTVCPPNTTPTGSGGCAWNGPARQSAPPPAAPTPHWVPGPVTPPSSPTQGEEDAAVRAEWACLTALVAKADDGVAAPIDVARRLLSMCAVELQMEEATMTRGMDLLMQRSVKDSIEDDWRRDALEAVMQHRARPANPAH